MALPSSGSLSLSQIQGEWGGSNPISLSEYYLGSLPTGRTNYGSIPSSGAISVGNFYGSNAAVSSFQIASGNSTYAPPSQYASEVRKLGRVAGFVQNGFATPTTFTMNGVSTQWFTTNYNVGNATYTLTLLSLQNGVTLGQPSPTSGYPANSGWTSVVLAGNGSSVTFNRTSATSYSTQTAGFTQGSNIIIYPAATWTFSGLSNIFPASNNTTNFTVTMTP